MKTEAILAAAAVLDSAPEPAPDYVWCPLTDLVVAVGGHGESRLPQYTVLLGFCTYLLRLRGDNYLEGLGK